MEKWSCHGFQTLTTSAKRKKPQQNQRKLKEIKTVARYLSRGLQLPTQEEVSGNSQNHKDYNERNNIECEVSVDHIQFLQCGDRRFEVTVGLEAPEFLATVAVGGQSGAFETVANVRKVSDPA